MKYFIILLFGVFFGVETVSACMPFFPREIIIATYQGVNYEAHPAGETRQYIHLSRSIRPYVTMENMKDNRYFLQSDNQKSEAIFSLRDYHSGDTIIAIGSYNDGQYEHEIAIYEIAKVTNTRGKVTFAFPQGHIKDWGKRMWQCGNYRPDDVKDEEELKKEIMPFLSNRNVKDSGNTPIVPLWGGIIFLFLVLMFGVFFLKKYAKES